MRQNKAITTVITAVLFLAVIIYMALYIAEALKNPLGTAEAIAYTAEETVSMSGWFIREEKLVSGKPGTVAYMVRQGERVPKDAEVARVYQSSTALTDDETFTALSGRAELLKAALSLLETGNLSEIKTQTTERVCLLSFDRSRGEFSAAEEEAFELKKLMLAYDIIKDPALADSANAELADLDRQLSTLKKDLSGDYSSIRVSASGYFSGSTDGYETVLTPEFAATATASDLESVTADKLDGEICGKLITDYIWRYISVLDTDHAALIDEGGFVNLRFQDEAIGSIRLRVERIGEDEGGKCVVVFRSDKSIGELVGYRRQNAEIVLSVYDGLRIPSAALRVCDGVTGVYKIVAQQVEFAPVDVIFDMDDYYLVSYDMLNADGLLPSDTVITQAKNLYDGKVIGFS